MVEDITSFMKYYVAISRWLNAHIQEFQCIYEFLKQVFSKIIIDQVSWIMPCQQVWLSVLEA